jgi:hypothetical protein
MQQLFYQIAVVIGLLLALLIFLKLIGVNLNEPSTPKKVVEVVTIETMENSVNAIDMNPSRNFCKHYEGNSFELNKKCKELTPSNCGSVECCIMNNGECVAGNSKYGATYKTAGNPGLLAAPATPPGNRTV